MFKSIRQRITTIFVFLVLTTEVLAGIFVTLETVKSYHDDFANELSEAFSDETKASLTDLAGASDTDELKNRISSTSLFDFNPAIEFAILDGSGEIKYTTADHEMFKDSKTAKEAIIGNETLNNKFFGTKIEYGMPLKSGDEVLFAVYILDDMTLLKSLIKRLAITFAILLPISAIVAFLFALLFSKSVTAPLKNLAEKAKKLADGDTSALSPAQGKDEISELTNALLYLSASKRENADKAMLEKNKLEAILQNMRDGIMAFDKNGKLSHINPEAMRLLNRKFVDDITFNKFFKEINADITLESLQYMPTGNAVEKTVTIADHVLQLSFALADSGIIVILHDITKHEKLERSRRDFVANVSHELRTPITVIKSYSDILADSPDADPQTRTRFLGTISSETDRMAKIISDLLTLSRLDENANYSRPTEDIDIRSMLEGLVERLLLSAKKKEQTLIYTPMNDVPKIKGDRDALERVFTNIISNALKYTPTGGKVEIFSSCVYNDILVKVSDTGIGISKEQLPNIFDRFYRVDKARSRDKGGTGLGLAIAKQTIESVFHGKILITSELNKGTDVTVTIPITKKK